MIIPESPLQALAGLDQDRDERRVTWAVTLDFHNTIARCDEWFDLEVYELVPAYLEWRSQSHDLGCLEDLKARGKACYRALRQRVIDSGIEIDAAESLAIVLESLAVPFSIEELDRALVDIFAPAVAGATPITGVVDSVRSLRATGVRLAVISSAAYHPFLDWTLAKFAIADCFDDVLTSASTGFYKSTPQIYATALDRLGVQPERCIHIGDSERFDVRPARSLGIRTVRLDGTESLEGAGSVAELRLSTLVDLPDRLYETFRLTIDH